MNEVGKLLLQAGKLARELGIDLADVAPTGRAISVADIRAHDTDGVRETRTRATGVRKHTADAMTASARTIPQVTEFVTVDVTATMDLVELLRPTITDAKLTPLTIVAKVALAMLAERPEVNSHWDDEGQEIVTPQYVNLGIAVAAPRGLLVPVVDDAHTMSMRELCRAIATAGERARSGHATPAELMGGTFTITNFGVFGVDAGTPLILPGQGAILGVGSIAKRPWVIGDDVVARWVTTLALTFDHRLIDGEQASALLAGLAAMLTDPRLLLGRV